MSHKYRIARLALVAALVLPALPDTAHAQLGSLRRKMEKELEKTVLGSDASSKSPEFNERVLEITDARITQLVAGLRAESAQAERDARDQAAENAKAAEYSAKSEAYGKCAKPFADELLKSTGKMMALAFAAQREEKANGKVGPALRDSIEALTVQMKKTGTDLETKCGKQPAEPSFDDMGGDDEESVGAKAAKLTNEQYAVLRERVAAHLRSGKGGDTGSYAYTAKEKAALSARASELAGFRKLLADSE